MWKFALRNLLSRPARSALSLLGLTVAIAGMVGLFSVARGLERTFDKSFKSIPGLIVMQSGAPIPLFSRLPLSWGSEIQQMDGVGVVTPEVLLRVNVIDGSARRCIALHVTSIVSPEAARLVSADASSTTPAACRMSCRAAAAW